MFNTKLFIVGVLVIGMLCAGLYFYNETKQDVNDKVYSGPVRPTDDESYFRQTGITRPLEVKR